MERLGARVQRVNALLQVTWLCCTWHIMRSYWPRMHYSHHSFNAQACILINCRHCTLLRLKQSPILEYTNIWLWFKLWRVAHCQQVTCWRLYNDTALASLFILCLRLYSLLFWLLLLFSNFFSSFVVFVLNNFSYQLSSDCENLNLFISGLQDLWAWQWWQGCVGGQRRCSNGLWTEW